MPVRPTVGEVQVRVAGKPDAAGLVPVTVWGEAVFLTQEYAEGFDCAAAEAAKARRCELSGGFEPPVQQVRGTGADEQLGL